MLNSPTRVRFRQILGFSSIAYCLKMIRGLDQSALQNCIPTLLRVCSRGLDGWGALRMGDFRQAQKRFASSLIEDPGDALIQTAMAKIIQADGNPEGASHAIAIAIWLGSSSADVNFLAGSIALAQGDESEALRYFENAVRANFLFSESDAYYARTFLRYFLEPDAVPQLYGLGFLSTSCMEFERIIDFLRELERQDLANQLGREQSGNCHSRRP